MCAFANLQYPSTHYFFACPSVSLGPTLKFMNSHLFHQAASQQLLRRSVIRTCFVFSSTIFFRLTFTLSASQIHLILKPNWVFSINVFPSIISLRIFLPICHCAKKQLPRQALSPIHSQSRPFQTVSPTAIQQSGVRTHFFHAEPQVLECFATFWATCVAVSASIYPDNLTWEVSSASERPPL